MNERLQADIRRARQADLARKLVQAGLLSESGRKAVELAAEKSP